MGSLKALNVREGRYGRISAIVLTLGVLTVLGLPALAEDQDGDWKDVTMIYTTDIKGKVDPCG